jgi:hypothetical protein
MKSPLCCTNCATVLNVATDAMLTRFLLAMMDALAFWLVAFLQAIVTKRMRRRARRHKRRRDRRWNGHYT